MTFRDLRTRSGLTQAQLAEQADLEQTTISQIERGKVRNPGILTVQAIARVLKVSQDVVVRAIAKTEAA
jgi:transcriptional regulator with XRE-family HTH domain